MNSAWSLQKTQILSRNSVRVSKSNTVITALQFCAIIILFRERDHSQLTTLASELSEPSGPGDGIG